MSLNASGSWGHGVRGACIATPAPARPRMSEREALSVGDVAEKLEHRLDVGVIRSHQVDVPRHRC